MLSLADKVLPSAYVPFVVAVELLDCCDAPFMTGTAEGMIAGGGGDCRQALRKARQLKSSDKSPGSKDAVWVDTGLGLGIKRP